MAKVVNISELAHLSSLSGLVLAYGHFSTIHAGHIRYLKNASQQGRVLVVAVIGDPKEGGSARYKYCQDERVEALQSVRYVDYIVCLEEEELGVVIRLLKPGVLVLGSTQDTSSKVSSAIDLLKASGGEVCFHAGDVRYSTSDLLDLTGSELEIKRAHEFVDTCSRSRLGYRDLVDCVNSWSSALVLVIGDVILDQYSACEALGMSAEAPVVVVRELLEKDFIGGAGIVAAHISKLGCRCKLLSVVGADATGEKVRRLIYENGVEDAIIVDKSRPTTFKKRYVVENQKLFRVSRLEQRNISNEVERLVIESIESSASECNAIVVSDFVYGVITKQIIEVINRMSEKYKIPVIGDVQCSSQVGSVLKFEGYDLLVPNEKEVRLAMQDQVTGLEELSQELIKRTECKNLLVSLGPEGFVLYIRDGKGNVVSERFPALCANPVDVAGAGDSVLAVMAAGIAHGADVVESAALACCMAAESVERMGNTPIGKEDLMRRLGVYLKPECDLSLF